MQIVESSALALRSARLVFRSDRSSSEVTLFPMLHLGTPEYFKTAYDDAFAHDVVLVEGVNSPISRRITRSYRWIRGNRTANLVVQPPYPRNLAARIVHADLSAEEFKAAWRVVPFKMRALVNVAAPCIGLMRRWFGTRKTLAKGQSLDDLKQRREILDLRPETLALTRIIMEQRDARLLETLRKELRTGGFHRLAVVYGASHMRTVIHEMISEGFHPAGSTWLTVFEI